MSTQTRTHRRLRSAVVAMFCAAATVTTAQADVTTTIAPGPEGEDVSYYTFIPLLNRGLYTTMYAHTAFSPTDEHSMATFVKFPIPMDILDISPGPAAGESTIVLDAFLLMNFAFSFSPEGEPPPPGGELSVHMVNQDWDELTLNYANHPTSDPPFTTLTNISAYGPIIFDVTEVVEQWIYGLEPNYGFELTNPFDNPIGFHTFESPADPLLKAQLVITVPEPGAAAMLVSGVTMLGLLGRARRRA